MLWKKVLRLLRRTCQWLAFLVFLTVALMAYLHFEGLPPEWKHSLLKELANRGVFLEIKSLRWDPLRGVVARQIQYKSNPDSTKGIEIGEIALNIDFIDWIRKRFSLETVSVDGSDIRIHTGGSIPPVLIRHVSGSIEFARGGMVYLRSVSGDFSNLHLEIDGLLDLVRSEPKGTTEASLNRMLDEQKLRLFLDKLMAIQAKDPIQVLVHVNGKAGDLANLRVKGQIISKSVRLEQWKADALTMQFSYTQGIFSMPVCTLESSGGKASITAVCDRPTKILQFELLGNLDPTTLRVQNGSPPKLTFGIRPEFWMKGKARLGSTSIWESLDADLSFSIHEAVWQGQQLFREAHGNGRLINGQLEIPSLSVVQDSGRLSGRTGYEFSTRTVSFDITSTLDLSMVMRLLYPSEKNWFRDVSYSNPPLIQMEGTWKIDDPNGLQAKGNLDWQEWSSHKVPIRSTASKVRIEGRKFSFENLHLTRDEGEIVGDFTLDFSSNSAALDVVTSVHFADLTRFIGPNTEVLFRPYQFITPPRIQLKGILNFADDRLNDLFAHVECQAFKVWKLRASNVVADVRSYRKSLEIAKYSSEFYGGRLEGNAIFDFTKPSQDWAFQCRAQDSDFDRFTHDLWDYNQVQGNLTGWVEMSGTMKSSRELKGRGEVKIADGVLWRIPLFGELSKFIPILGVQKATKCHATFTVADEKAMVDDMKISAGIMSLTAKGTYQFDQSLDFVVQGHFLRALFGIGYLLDPLTKPFEYHLGGKLQARKWKPRFIPKELLFQFGEDAPLESENTNAAPTQAQ